MQYINDRNGVFNTHDIEQVKLGVISKLHNSAIAPKSMFRLSTRQRIGTFLNLLFWVFYVKVDAIKNGDVTDIKVSLFNPTDIAECS